MKGETKTKAGDSSEIEKQGERSTQPYIISSFHYTNFTVKGRYIKLVFTFPEKSVFYT